jgi:hypothetical protein
MDPISHLLKKEKGVGMHIMALDRERIRPNLRLLYHRESLEILCRFILSRGQVDSIPSLVCWGMLSDWSWRETVESLRDAGNHAGKSYSRRI